MTNIKILILIFGFGFLLNSNLLACKCKQIKRDSYVTIGLKYSDVVFLGELIDSDTTGYNYTFKVLEIFKGNYNNKIIKGYAFNSCSLHPTDKGLWLIYANFQKDSLIDVGACGSSVSLKSPGGLYYPPQVSFDEKSPANQFEWEIEGLNKKIEGLSSWYYDLYKLREYKRSNLNKTPKAKVDYQLVILLFSLVLNIFMFTMIIKKKKKMPTPNLP